MAPLRSHVAHLFDTHQTPRKVSFWYGARSLQEVFYQNYFTALAARHGNFSFHLALSEPQPADAWAGATGFIHEVVLKNYLSTYRNLAAINYYLCGPPPMIAATTAMLAGLGVAKERISFAAF